KRLNIYIPSNKHIIHQITHKLNLLNQTLIHPHKFHHADSDQIKQIHTYLSMKHSFTPTDMTAIPHSLAQLRH
ncbi:DUF1128 family protein, partial [Staphylococcus pettenkoferi]|uniref:DUF1128 family protein n=1 Tax=Staphylococcus pettenkoferi TaxID=170573 RepID=UPI0021B5DCB6